MKLPSFRSRAKRNINAVSIDREGKFQVVHAPIVIPSLFISAPPRKQLPQLQCTPEFSLQNGRPVQDVLSQKMRFVDIHSLALRQVPR